MQPEKKSHKAIITEEMCSHEAKGTIEIKLLSKEEMFFFLYLGPNENYIAVDVILGGKLN